MRFILGNGCSSGREKIHEWFQGMVMVGLTGEYQCSARSRLFPAYARCYHPSWLELKLYKAHRNNYICNTVQVI